MRGCADGRRQTNPHSDALQDEDLAESLVSLGAEHISAALASTVQLPRLKLHFYSGFDIGLRRGHYEFLRVEYLNSASPAEKWPISSLWKRPPQCSGRLSCSSSARIPPSDQAVHSGRGAPPDRGLARRTRSMTQHGSDILAFFYDEKSDEFIARPLTQLEPLRERDI